MTHFAWTLLSKPTMCASMSVLLSMNSVHAYSHSPVRKILDKDGGSRSKFILWDIFTRASEFCIGVQSSSVIGVDFVGLIWRVCISNADEHPTNDDRLPAPKLAISLPLEDYGSECMIHVERWESWFMRNGDKKKEIPAALLLVCKRLTMLVDRQSRWRLIRIDTNPFWVRYSWLWR